MMCVMCAHREGRRVELNTLLASQINSTSLEIQNPFEVLKETLIVSLVSPRGINSQGDTREKSLIKVT